MKNLVRKLDVRGVAHHTLLAVLVVSTFAGFGAWRVFSSSAASSTGPTPAVNKQKKENGCYPGQYKVQGNCKTYTQAEKVKADCTTFHLQYDKQKNECKNACMQGYSAKEGTCKKVGTSAVPPGGDAISEEECTKQHRVYDSAANLCTLGCSDGWRLKESKLPCVEIGAGCAAGYYIKDGLCVPQSSTNTNATNLQAQEKNCTAEHREWDPKAKKCTNVCRTGFVLKDNKLPCVPVQPGPCTADTVNPGSTRCHTSDPNEGSDGEADKANKVVAKIILYDQKNFKGDKIEITEATPKLDKKWDNKASSYKIISGRWQICQDPDYKTNCAKPWASDPDMTQARKIEGSWSSEDKKKAENQNKGTNLNNKVSSLRPVVIQKFQDTEEDVRPLCVAIHPKSEGTNTYPVKEDGSCPEGTKLSCPTTPPGLQVVNRECKLEVLEPDMVVPVDASFKGKDGQEKCLLLGREWIAKPSNKEINGGEYGCSTETCNLRQDGRPKRLSTSQSDKNAKNVHIVCVSYKFDAPYAVKLSNDPTESKKRCGDLSRVWIEQSQLCAQVPNRKDKNQTVVNAPQCTGKNKVYYIFSAEGKDDQCFNPTVFERAKSVVKAVGGALSAALKQGPKAYCNTVKKGNYHWDGNKCVIDKKKCWNGNSIPVTGKCPARPSNPTGNGNNNAGDNGSNGGGSINGNGGNNGGSNSGGSNSGNGGNNATQDPLCQRDPSLPSCQPNSGGNNGNNNGPSAEFCAQFPQYYACYL